MPSLSALDARTSEDLNEKMSQVYISKITSGNDILEHNQPRRLTGRERATARLHGKLCKLLAVKTGTQFIKLFH